MGTDHLSCEVIITSIRGPKEYYGDKAFVVNPYSVDEIGRAVCDAMQGRFQPSLKEEIDELYSPEKIVDLLFKGYLNILH